MLKINNKDTRLKTRSCHFAKHREKGIIRETAQ